MVVRSGDHRCPSRSLAEGNRQLAAGLPSYTDTSSDFAIGPALAAHEAGERVERRLPLAVRCRNCGEVGRVQVRPPVPTRGGSVGWPGAT